MYLNLRPLKRSNQEKSHSRSQYRSSGYASFVPIVAVEIRALARNFPLVWRKRDDEFELGALMFLMEGFGEQRAHMLSRIRCPLLVEAYPLALAAGREDQATVLVDDIGPESDQAGQAIFNENGEATDAGARRLAALRIFAEGRSDTNAMSRTLAGAGLLEDWPVKLPVDGEIVELRGLAIVARRQERRDALPALIEKQGLPLAELVTLHDLSLFNMQSLVDFHRSEKLFARAASA